MNIYHPISLGQDFDEIPYLDRVEEENEILKIFFSSNADEYFVLRFENFAAYRRSKESYAYKKISELAAADLLGKVFYEITDSDFSDWFSSDASGLAETISTKVYLISLAEDFFEVLAEEPPQFVVLAQQNRAARGD
jgi:hypothetical protein